MLSPKYEFLVNSLYICLNEYSFKYTENLAQNGPNNLFKLFYFICELITGTLFLVMLISLHCSFKNTKVAQKCTYKAEGKPPSLPEVTAIKWF